LNCPSTHSPGKPDGPPDLPTIGITSPTGGTPEKPIGLVYIGLADAHGSRVEELRLDPTLSRDAIRQRTAEATIELLTATQA